MFVYVSKKSEARIELMLMQRFVKNNKLRRNRVGDELQQFLKHFHSHQGHKSHACGCILR